ncbi:hydroquinone glucosyltransferase-like [Juglans microcarpa x Juglans regia]|uniref:hydroquinone glucosyltransferase-like n=1 Tax=Juglans microcarpa x Juglans regia TaxID=2249226 RepID=UPI001B7F2408|nr:hydroquinone glucosyltransferase-like [Juglans microcarpa x Juglans regia]
MYTPIMHSLPPINKRPPYLYLINTTYPFKSQNKELLLMSMAEKPHIAILTSPGMGHLIPLIEFAKVLLALPHGFNVTCIIPTIGYPSKAMKAVLEGLPTNIDHVFLPPVSPKDLEEAHPGIQIFLTITLSLPSLRDVLKSLLETTRLSALVFDPFASDVLEVAKELQLSPYFFIPTNAMVLSLLLHLPTLDETIPCEYRDLPKPLKLPGCIPIHGRDLIYPIQDRKSEWYKLFLRSAKRLPLAEGIIVNTFTDLEGRVIKALKEDEAGYPPIYPVGPIIQSGSGTDDENDGSGCLRWLDNQPGGSVLFVSFGSGGTLSSDQINELALGLESSGKKFLWVTRSPNNESANTTYLKNQSHDNPLAFLPQGFLARTKGQGLVVPSWAPQAQILSHASTGGFLTHCGWNSTLESIMINGTPLIAWPLYAEQRMNAVFLVEDLKVALRPKADEKGLVGREEIAKVVQGLMAGEEGKSVRKRTKELMIAGEKAKSAGGSSTRALSELASKLAFKPRSF